MPKKVTSSNFMERLAQAHEEHKDDETRIGSGGDLPGGIEGGIARLVDAHIGIYASGPNEGQPFFMAAGAVQEPKEVSFVDPVSKKPRVMPIEGLRTQIGPEPLCDTTTQAGKETSLAEHWDRVLNWLRLLGIDTKTLDPSDVIAEPEEGKFETGPVLVALADKENAPTFRFRTWQGKPTEQYPNPRVNHEWRGVCEYTPDGADGVTEEVAEEPKWEKDAEAEAPKAPAKTSPKAPAKAPTKAPAPPKQPPKAPPKAAEAEDDDIEALGKAAQDGDEEAQRKLVGHAKLAGIEGYEDMPTWNEVAAAILAHDSEQPEAEEPESEETEPAEQEEEWAPIEDEIGLYTPPKAKKPIEVTFGKVYMKLKKCDVTDNATKKVTKAVPFDQLAAG